MTTEELIIAAVRIGGALLVLRWAFAGSIAAILIDFSDLFMMNLLDLGGVRNYQSLDKWLDLAYMLTFLWVALRWTGPPRTIAAALFAYRILGVLTFEAIGSRTVLLFFPNVFEFWFVFVAAARHYKPNVRPNLAPLPRMASPPNSPKGVPGIRPPRRQMARQLPRHRRSSSMVELADNPKMAGPLTTPPSISEKTSADGSPDRLLTSFFAN